MPKQRFAEAHQQAEAAVKNFVTALRSDERPEDEDDMIADLVDAGGKAVLGIWRELHRIAQKLDPLNS